MISYTNDLNYFNFNCIYLFLLMKGRHIVRYEENSMSFYKKDIYDISANSWNCKMIDNDLQNYLHDLSNKVSR